LSNSTNQADLQYLQDENRVGKFIIAQKYVLDSRIRKALSQCVILRAEQRFDLHNSIEYIAYCPSFSPSSHFHEPNVYYLFESDDGFIRWYQSVIAETLPGTFTNFGNF
jgi:hypothetical protein